MINDNIMSIWMNIRNIINKEDFFMKKRSPDCLDSFLEQIRMCTCSNQCKCQFTFFYSINEKPIRLNMAFSKVSIIACQFVVTIFFIKWTLISQFINNVFQLFQIFSTFLHQLIVFFEGMMIPDFKHLNHRIIHPQYQMIC